MTSRNMCVRVSAELLPGAIVLGTNVSEGSKIAECWYTG